MFPIEGHCCVDRSRDIPVCGDGRECWSDRFDEFVECCDKAHVLMLGFCSEFVVAAS